MGKVTSIVIDEQLDVFIGEQVNQGRFKTADAVVEAGLRLLQKREAEIEAIRAAIIEGEESGEPVEFDRIEFLDRMNRTHVR